ncbi:MAG TPA: aromatic ring-hydroxylating dioxygenase subunit alpha [Oceanospirillaceae bacterium]|nr:aromatic ring-hydroxylating dioxygenase subunit alpha [Oceanospirillaceae bacterium]
MASLTPLEFDAAALGYAEDPCESWSLGSQCYIDGKYQAIEKAHVFAKSWQFICHEEALQNAGDYIAQEVAGQPILVVRNQNNELQAFYNVCKHRGHLLAEGQGNMAKIVCPYHSWNYDLKGQLLAAPRSKLIENFDTAEVCLDQVQVEVFCHLVFVNLDSAAASLASQTGDLGDEIMTYAPDLSKLTYAAHLSYKIKANWKAVTDNFLECYHCTTAHKDFVSLVDMQTYKVKTHGIYSSHLAKAKLTGNAAYNIDDAAVTDHAVWYLWPNIALMRYPGRGNFMVWQFNPAGPEETYEEFNIYFETADVTEAEQEALKFIDEELQVEDINLVESVQRGMNTPAFQSGRIMANPDGEHGMSEHAVHHFHGMLLEAYKRAIK